MKEDTPEFRQLLMAYLAATDRLLRKVISEAKEGHRIPVNVVLLAQSVAKAQDDLEKYARSQKPVTETPKK